MNIFYGLFDCVKRKKGYFCCLLLLSLLAVVLGVIAAVNFGGGVFAVDLSNIAYIKFLKGGGFVTMIFGLILSLTVFFLVILICNCKPFLMPLGVLFYLYLVYSQAVILMSIILIYGILNCIILVILLLVYTLIIWAMFLCVLCELSCFCGQTGYFRNCFSFKNSKVMLYVCGLYLLTFIFAMILLILKSYVILLIF